MASQFPLKKNTAAKVVFPIYDADGDLVSGAADLDSEYSLNGGAFADCTNEATEIGSSGIYYLDLTADETNGDQVAIQVKTSTSGAKTTVLVFYTGGNTLDELKTEIDDLETQLNALSAKVDDLESDVSNLSTNLAQLASLLKTVFAHTV
ncbi:MAG: hypothetical protein WC551_08055 [Patescibacteria group bacterium]